MHLRVDGLVGKLALDSGAKVVDGPARRPDFARERNADCAIPRDRDRQRGVDPIPAAEVPVDEGSFDRPNRPGPSSMTAI